MINNPDENCWWLKKCLVCDEYHESVNLPCTNYKWVRGYDLAIEGGDYSGTFNVRYDEEGKIKSINKVINL